METSKQIVAIGDIHGCYLTLVALVEKIKNQIPDSEIVLVGDCVDRGPRSAEVVQFVIDNEFKCVQGNHEQMMYTDLDETTKYPGTWKMNGGDKTIKSYNNDQDLLAKHAKWMTRLPVFISFPDIKNENGDFLVISHSTIQDYWENRKIIPGLEDEVLWNRNYISEAKGMHQGIFNIHGHSPVPSPQIGKFHANIDTGCVYKRAHYGVLTALAFPSMEIITQENID